MTDYMNGQTILIAVLVLLLGTIIVIAVTAVRRRIRIRHHLEFEKARSRNYDEYSKAYADALKTLGKQWDVIEIIHDWSEFNLGPAGLPEYITFEEAFEIVRQIRAAKDEPIAVVIHTMGGYSVPTDMIAKALSQHKGRKVAFVPYMAMSGGTVIALATEEIYMGPSAVLGPIDTQYGNWPASAFAYLKKEKKADTIDDAHLMMIHISEQFEKDAVNRANKLVNSRHGPNVAAELILGGRPHGETISVAEATELKINIAKKNCPKESYTLVDAKIGMVSKNRETIFRRGLDVQNKVGERRSKRLLYGGRISG